VLAHLLAHCPADIKGENNQLAIGACGKKGEGGKTMAMGIRVAGDEEGERDEAVVALATRVECNKESNGFGGKSNGNEGGMGLRQQGQWQL